MLDIGYSDVFPPSAAPPQQHQGDGGVVKQAAGEGAAGDAGGLECFAERLGLVGQRGYRASGRQEERDQADAVEAQRPTACDHVLGARGAQEEREGEVGAALGSQLTGSLDARPGGGFHASVTREDDGVDQISSCRSL